MRLAAGLAALLLSAGAAATPPDIKVSTDDLNDPGEHWLEFQVNKGSRAGPAAAEARRPLQFLGEYSYGIAEGWQAAVKLPFSILGRPVSDGADLELRYIAPHDEDKGGYWGFNLGAGRGREELGERGSAAEIVPVLGYRAGRLNGALNLAWSKPLSGDERKTEFSYAAKVAARGAGKNEYGFELFKSPETRYLFLVWDGLLGKSEFNVGIGRGLTEASDRWVLKLVYALQLGGQ